MSKGKHVGYVRVSSVDQHTARQLQGVELDRTFEDRCSGKTRHRPQLQACLDYLREEDILHIHSLDRLARNVEDLLSIVRELAGRDVTVIFHKENLVFSPEGQGETPNMSRLLLTMLGAIAEFERSLIKERQREGIALAKAAGKYRGRPSSLSEATCAEIRSLKETGVPIAAIARKYGRSRRWVYGALAKGGDKAA